MIERIASVWLLVIAVATLVLLARMLLWKFLDRD